MLRLEKQVLREVELMMDLHGIPLAIRKAKTKKIAAGPVTRKAPNRNVQLIQLAQLQTLIQKDMGANNVPSAITMDNPIDAKNNFLARNAYGMLNT